MAGSNDTQILKMLLKAGADPNLLDQNNESPLLRATERSELPMVKSLLSLTGKQMLHFKRKKSEIFSHITQILPKVLKLRKVMTPLS